MKKNNKESNFFIPNWVYRYILIYGVAMIAVGCTTPQRGAVQVTTVPSEVDLIIRESMENIPSKPPRYYSVGIYSVPFIRGQEIRIGAVKIDPDIGSGVYQVLLQDGVAEDHVIGLGGKTFLVETLENGQEVRARVIAVEIVNNKGDYILIFTVEEVLKSLEKIEGLSLAARLNQAWFDGGSQPVVPESQYSGTRSYITFSLGESVEIGGRKIEYVVVPFETEVNGGTLKGLEELVLLDGDPLPPVNGRRCFVGDDDGLVYCIEEIKPFVQDFLLTLTVLSLY